MSEVVVPERIVANISISLHEVRNLLCNGIEGGIGYWATISGYKLAEGLKYEDFKEGGKMQEPDCYFHPFELIPTVPGCVLLIQDNEDESEPTFELTLEKLVKSFDVMREKCPHHLGDFFSGNDDATTGDVFIQCALFGEIVYG